MLIKSSFCWRVLATTPTEITPSWFLLHTTLPSHAYTCKWLCGSKLPLASQPSPETLELASSSYDFFFKLHVCTSLHNNTPLPFSQAITKHKMKEEQIFAFLSYNKQWGSVGASKRQHAPLCVSISQPESSLFGNQSSLLLFLEPRIYSRNQVCQTLNIILPAMKCSHRRMEEKRWWQNSFLRSWISNIMNERLRQKSGMQNKSVNTVSK